MLIDPMTNGARLEAMPKKPEALDVDRRPGRPRARLVQGVLLGLALVGLIFVGFVRAAEESAAHRAEADRAQATEASPPKNERHGKEDNEAAQQTRFKTDWPAGKRFRDFDDGPELQVAETDGPSDRALAYSDAVTDAEWEKCVIAGGCKTVKIVSLVGRTVGDQLDYVDWVSKESDKGYWLMTRAEFCHRSAKCDFAGRTSWGIIPFQWHRMTPPPWDSKKFQSDPYVGPPPSHVIDAAMERLRKERAAFHVARWVRGE